jgi:hypothetical protein
MCGSGHAQYYSPWKDWCVFDLASNLYESKPALLASEREFVNERFGSERENYKQLTREFQ